MVSSIWRLLYSHPREPSQKPLYSMTLMTLVTLLLIAIGVNPILRADQDPAQNATHGIPYLRYRIIPIKMPHSYYIYSAHLRRNGTVVGEVRNGRDTVNITHPNGGSFAFTWKSGKLQLYPAPDGFGTAEAIDISDDGKRVIGTATTTYDGAWLWRESSAVIWESGRVRRLAPLPGMYCSGVNHFGASGDIVGWSSEQPTPTNTMTSDPKMLAKVLPCQWTGAKYSVAAPYHPGYNANKSANSRPRYQIRKEYGDNDQASVTLIDTQTHLQAVLNSRIPKSKRLADVYGVDSQGRVLAEISRRKSNYRCFVILAPISPIRR
jgi:hypothetical protein